MNDAQNLTALPVAESAQSVERRGAQRVSVEFFVQERDGDRLFVHPATNLSATGIFIESASYSLRNSMERRFIDLEIDLADVSDTQTSQEKVAGEMIAVRGEVVGARRVRGFSHGLAVRFLNLTTADRDRVSAFVGRRLAEGAAEGSPHEAAPIY